MLFAVMPFMAGATHCPVRGWKYMKHDHYNSLLNSGLIIDRRVGLHYSSLTVVFLSGFFVDPNDDTWKN